MGRGGGGGVGGAGRGVGGEVVGLRRARGKELLEIHVPDVDVFYDCLVCGHPCAFCQRLLTH